MNAALKEVSGEYLTSLDIDDLMTKDCISKKVSWLKANPSYALVRSNGYFLFPNQEKRLFYANRQISTRFNRIIFMQKTIRHQKMYFLIS